VNDRSPLQSLADGNWFKLICGASFQDVALIRNLTLAYSLAGADCIDVAADKAVITAALEGMVVAGRQPWLMVSVNDGEDPHFRKAHFNARLCPPHCPRPCEKICPALAIDEKGVIEDRCYGCGRCIPICPLNLIEAEPRRASIQEILPWIETGALKAVEIHTQIGHEEDFLRLWKILAPSAENLGLLAISCQDGPGLMGYLKFLLETIQFLPCPLIWQTDGRPMSGDIGKGTTHPAIKMAQKVLSRDLPGFVQLAGGTNAHTVRKLKEMGLLKRENERGIAGVAYGSYARSLLMPILQQLPPDDPFLENHPQHLRASVKLASELVHQIKNLDI
jgi:Fe-S-cluster-containing hydrogenase component 2